LHAMDGMAPGRVEVVDVRAGEPPCRWVRH
jgi:hypothetical protein